MRGRKPVPTELHVLSGTYRSTRHGRDRRGEPVADGELAPLAPSWMSESQQEGWRYAIEHAPRGLLKPIDAGVLSIWVIAEDDHRRASEAQARLDRDNALPMLTKDGKGNPAVSPYQVIKKNAALLMLKSASELGFSPASRPRLAGLGDELDDSLEADSWAELQSIVSSR
jgi:P27 family predicted phage terminase small subunit